MKKCFILFLILLLTLNTYLMLNSKKTIKINNIIKEEFIEKKYKEYNVGDIIEINDDNWYVINYSSTKEDYVTLINTNYEKSIMNCNNKYEISNEKRYFEGEYSNNLNVDLKEIDGYKIRLIRLDEYSKLGTLIKKDIDKMRFDYKINYNYDWVKDINSLTMTDVDYYYEVKDSCASWYIQGSTKEVLGKVNGFINIQPVINLAKEEL